MNCSKIQEIVYEEDSTSLFNQIQVWLHTLYCQDCAQKAERFEITKIIMKEDFFPSSPTLEDSIMARIAKEEQTEAHYAIPGGISTRGWVIAGVIVMISLITVFFGLDFQNLANEYGTSFILPLGISIGIVLTSYCALFIGSHLKELSERFGL